MNSMECSHLSSTYPAQPSYTRLLHAAPDTPPVDVYVNGTPVVKNLRYKQFAGYFTVAPCMYHIQVFTSGKRELLLTEACFDICPKSTTTFALIGDPSLLAIPENYAVSRLIRNRYRAYVRFVNLSPNTAALDAALNGGTVLFRNVCFKAHTHYLPVDPGIYMFRLKPAGSTGPGLLMAPVTVEQGSVYTVYAVGLAGGSPPLETIISTDGVY